MDAKAEKFILKLGQKISDESSNNAKFNVAETLTQVVATLPSSPLQAELARDMPHYIHALERALNRSSRRCPTQVWFTATDFDKPNCPTLFQPEPKPLEIGAPSSVKQKLEEIESWLQRGMSANCSTFYTSSHATTIMRFFTTWLERMTEILHDPHLTRAELKTLTGLSSSGQRRFGWSVGRQVLRKERGLLRKQGGPLTSRHFCPSTDTQTTFLDTYLELVAVQWVCELLVKTEEEDDDDASPSTLRQTLRWLTIDSGVPSILRPVCIHVPRHWMRYTGPGKRSALPRPFVHFIRPFVSHVLPRSTHGLASPTYFAWVRLLTDLGDVTTQQCFAKLHADVPSGSASASIKWKRTLDLWNRIPREELLDLCQAQALLESTTSHVAGEEEEGQDPLFFIDTTGPKRMKVNHAF